MALVGEKNYLTRATRRDELGQQRYDWEYVPLADGMAPLPDFFGRLQQIGYDGIVTLHSKYKGAHSFRRLSTPELLKQSAEDLRHLKRILGQLPIGGRQ